jgi:hypothetical protein
MIEQVVEVLGIAGQHPLLCNAAHGGFAAAHRLTLQHRRIAQFFRIAGSRGRRTHRNSFRTPLEIMMMIMVVIVVSSVCSFGRLDRGTRRQNIG